MFVVISQESVDRAEGYNHGISQLKLTHAKACYILELSSLPSQHGVHFQRRPRWDGNLWSFLCRCVLFLHMRENGRYSLWQYVYPRAASLSALLCRKLFYIFFFSFQEQMIYHRQKGRKICVMCLRKHWNFVCLGMKCWKSNICALALCYSFFFFSFAANII